MFMLSMFILFVVIPGVIIFIAVWIDDIVNDTFDNRYSENFLPWNR